MGKLIVVMATTPDLGCASQGRLPWNRPADGKWFKEATLNKVCIMGGKTYDEIVEILKGPLPDRISLVYCQTPRVEEYDVVFATTPKALLDNIEVALTAMDVMLTGGQETIAALSKLMKIDEVWHTVVWKQPDHTPDVFLEIPGFDLNGVPTEILRTHKDYVVHRHVRK